MLIKFFKDANGNFWINDEMTPSGNHCLKIEGQSVAIWEFQTKTSVFNGPVTNLLKENNDSYVDTTELLSAVNDFFVKASQGGASQTPTSVINEATWINGLTVDLTGKFTLVGNTFVNAQPIELQNLNGILPAGLASYDSDKIGGTIYYVGGKSGDDFFLYTFWDLNTKVIPTTIGTGTTQCREARPFALIPLDNLQLNTPIKYTITGWCAASTYGTGLMIGFSDHNILPLAMIGNADWGIIIGNRALTYNYISCNLTIEVDKISNNEIILRMGADMYQTSDKQSGWENALNYAVNPVLTYYGNNDVPDLKLYLGTGSDNMFYIRSLNVIKGF